MKVFWLVLVLTFGFSIGNAQKRKCVPTTTPPRDNQVQLRLTTTVADVRYSIENGAKLLRVELDLNYLNVGARATLLDKKSSVIYRKIISRNLKAASACKYLHDISSHFIGVESMRRAGFRLSGEPEKSEFITLMPGETLQLKDEIILHLYDGSKDTEDYLHPGNYILQVRVAAWFYAADPAEWEQKWGGEAYLWSENVTSEPMPFTVEKR